MQANDWTPAVLITATISLVTVGMVWLVAPWGHGDGRAPGPTLPRHPAPPTVMVWTGDLAPGLKGVLGPVWGDALPDRDHDQLLNAGLGLEGDRALAYFRLLVFNTTDEARSLPLVEGVIRVRDAEGDALHPLRSLARMVENGEVAVPANLAFSLRSFGTLSERIEIPAGRVAKLVVAFDGPVRLERASKVVTADGTDLHPRQMATAVFRRLIEDPDEARVKDL